MSLSRRPHTVYHCGVCLRPFVRHAHAEAHVEETGHNDLPIYPRVSDQWFCASCGAVKAIVAVSGLCSRCHGPEPKEAAQ